MVDINFWYGSPNVHVKEGSVSVIHKDIAKLPHNVPKGPRQVLPKVGNATEFQKAAWQ
jgi:hypothetical protein